MSDEPKEIRLVIIFQNGMTAVFDSDHQQVPELQGFYHEKKAEIIKRLALQEELPEIKREAMVRDE